jgi:hypothetical protein
MSVVGEEIIVDFIVKVSRLGLAAALVTTGLVVTAPAGPASAAARDGRCDSGEFCLYYLSDRSGSVSDFTTSIPDYGASQPTCYEFRGPGAGQYQCVKNNAMSVWNRRGGTVKVYYNSGYGGASQSFSGGSSGNLNATLSNENASHRFF